MTLDASGNLLLGTTSNTYSSRLAVIGSGNGFLELGQATSSTLFQSNGQDFYLNLKGTGNIVFRNGSGDTERFRIASTGAATFTGNNANNNTENASVSWNDANANLMGKIVGYRGVNGNDGNLRFYTNNVTPTLAMTLTSTGAATFTSSIQTGAPTNGTAQPWKLGNAVSGGVTTNHYIIVEINGTTYTINALNGLP